MTFLSTTSFDQKCIDFSTGILDNAMEMADGLRHIGVGIGSIMLLIVILYYVISILDGGKFQTKMLVPLFLFFLVCNFNWVSKPVLMFTSTITKSISQKLQEKKNTFLNPDGGTDIVTINDAYVNKYISDPDDPTNLSKENDDTQTDTQGAESEGDISNQKPTTFFKDFWKAFRRSSAIGVISEFAISAKSSVSDNLTSERLSFSGLLCQLMSWICAGVSFCLKIFGLMLTSIVVVFGPITFAFAIFPGRSSNIISWFIRICQFSLYGPLCCFIDAFTVASYCLLDDTASGAVGFLMVFALTLANLVGLVSVPTIASMIIEGASGAISLSQGLQTISGASMAAGGALTVATVGKNNAVGNFATGMGHKGLYGFVKDWRHNIGSEDADGNRYGVGGAFMKTMRDITEYGSGGVYGWNRDPSQGQNSGPQS